MRRWITSRRLRYTWRLEVASNGTVNVVQINTKSREKMGKSTCTHSGWVVLRPCETFGMGFAGR